MEQEKAIWQLLRAGLQVAVPDDDLFSHVSEEGWRSLMQLARQNRVTAVCCDGLELLPAESRPPRLLFLQWIAQREQIQIANEAKERETRSLLRLFKESGIPARLLKGARVATCYPRPLSREYDDIDIFHFGHHLEADHYIKERLNIYIDHSDPHHSVYDYHGIMVENHYTLTHNPYTSGSRRYEQMLLQEPPSPTFDALFLMRHAACHFAASHITVKTLCDWAMFVRRHGDDIDWSHVSQQFHDSGMEPFAEALHGLAVEALHAQPIEQLPMPDNKVLQRLSRDLLYGEFTQAVHPEENISRAFWKIRRYRANRWKRRMVYGKAESALLWHNIAKHLAHPANIIRHR